MKSKQNKQKHMNSKKIIIPVLLFRNILWFILFFIIIICLWFLPYISKNKIGFLILFVFMYPFLYLLFYTLYNLTFV